MALPRHPFSVSDELAPIKKAVEERLGAKGREPFAVFDFDNTCIVNDIGEATFAYLCGHELLRDRSLLGATDDSRAYHERVFHTYHALLEEGQIKAAYMLIGRLFSGFTPGEAEAATLSAISEEGSRLGSKMLYDVHIERGLAVRPHILSLMEFLRGKNVRIWVVNASHEVAVRAAMQHFGIKADLVGVKTILRKGVFTSELVQPMPIIEGKIECMRKFIDPARMPLIVVDDSTTGLPLLETADIKVVVDRDNELARIARERGWFVI